MGNSGSAPIAESREIPVANGSPWIKPMDRLKLCEKRRELEAMSKEKLERELQHFGVDQSEIDGATNNEKVFEKFKHKWVDMAIAAQTLDLVINPTGEGSHYARAAAQGYAKGEGCEDFLARSEASVRGHRVGGGKTNSKKSKKRKSMRKSKRKKSKKGKTRRKRR